METSVRIRALRTRTLRPRTIPALAAVLGASILVAAAARAADSSPIIYRLTKTSTFQRGCFAPCLCPVMEQGTEIGTFTLTPSGVKDRFQNFVVSGVNWTVTLPSGDIRVTGSGTYKVSGGAAAQQQLSLDLVVGANPVQHFDSGLVSGGGDFPRINATISINGVYCFDTVFTIDASPVPADQIQPYRLCSGSTFQRGCSGPCACAPGPELPMKGSFLLVGLEPDPMFTDYAMVMVDWLVAPDPSSATAAFLPLTGSGMYRMGGEVALEQQMTLNLEVGPQPPVLFDSGLVPGGEAFPRINIEVVNGAGSCVTTILNVCAKPAPRLTSAAPAAQ